jgi:hypothetical protein
MMKKVKMLKGMGWMAPKLMFYKAVLSFYWLIQTYIDLTMRPSTNLASIYKENNPQQINLPSKNIRSPQKTPLFYNSFMEEKRRHPKMESPNLNATVIEKNFRSPRRSERVRTT